MVNLMEIVIWDADDTLWDGTIYHGDSVKLKEETKEILKQIDKIGITQIICSRNNYEELFNTLTLFGIEKYFKEIVATVPIDKAEEINKLITKYKIKPEEVLFIDDNNSIREHVKLVTKCNVDYDKDLYNIMKYFDTKRLVIMNQQRKRITAEKEWSGSYREFLKRINMEVTIKLANKSEIPRIADLANRTNELNSCRNRYTEGDIEKFINSENNVIYVAYMKDIYGDYGLIGEVILEYLPTNEIFIKDICISCRTMGRGIGSKLLTYVNKLASEDQNIKSVIAHILPTKENFRMKQLFEGRGYKFTGHLNNGKIEVYKNEY